MGNPELGPLWTRFGLVEFSAFEKSKTLLVSSEDRKDRLLLLQRQTAEADLLKDCKVWLIYWLVMICVHSHCITPWRLNLPKICMDKHCDAPACCQCKHSTYKSLSLHIIANLLFSNCKIFWEFHLLPRWKQLPVCWALELLPQRQPHQGKRNKRQDRPSDYKENHIITHMHISMFTNNTEIDVYVFKYIYICGCVCNMCIYIYIYTHTYI